MKLSGINLPLDHIGIAVKDLDTTTTTYSELMGARVVHDEEVISQRVRVRFLDTGGVTKLELIQATSDDSPVAKFIAKRGEGIHHIAFKVENIDKEYHRLKTEGFHLLQDAPIPGANNKLIFFIHPKSTGGTLVEICQSHK